MSTQAAREVRSAYLADPGARDALRVRWPALSMALERLVAEERGLLSPAAVTEISNRWSGGPWGSPPARQPTIEG